MGSAGLSREYQGATHECAESALSKAVRPEASRSLARLETGMLACRCARTQSEEPDSGSYGLEKLALPGFASVLQDASACLARSHIRIGIVPIAPTSPPAFVLVPAISHSKAADAAPASIATAAA